MSLAPAKDPRSVVQRVVVLLAAGLVLVFGARYLLTRPASFSGNGVSFDYPASWEKVSGQFTPPAGSIELLWTQGFALDDVNGAGVGAAATGTAVPTLVAESALKQQMEPLLREAVEGAGGTLSAPRSVDIAGTKGLTYEIEGIGLGTPVAEVSLTVFAQGQLAYFIACQSTPDMSEQVREGCATIHASFETSA